MKHMKLGSKPDVFQTEGSNIRFVATELATDIVISIGDVKFYLHKVSTSYLYNLLLSCCDILRRIHHTNIGY
uniref:Uncharacterized protein n=1 Tax=Aegilops tauschii subsp. strangulata TaxID=200361 RepID=A0A453HE51_AEGTS